MDEIDARTCLTKTYGLSDDFVNSFLAPFVEGIYLTSLVVGEYIIANVAFRFKDVRGGIRFVATGWDANDDISNEG